MSAPAPPRYYYYRAFLRTRTRVHVHMHTHAHTHRDDLARLKNQLLAAPVIENPKSISFKLISEGSVCWFVCVVLCDFTHSFLDAVHAGLAVIQPSMDANGKLSVPSPDYVNAVVKAAKADNKHKQPWMLRQTLKNKSIYPLVDDPEDHEQYVFSPSLLVFFLLLLLLLF